MMRNLGIYIHIPFCVSKCAYCDFFSAPADEGVREKYAAALVRQIKENTLVNPAGTPLRENEARGIPVIR